MLGHATRHCLARLADFEGRTSREVYQPFANLVVGPVVAVILFLSFGGILLFVDAEALVDHGAGRAPGAAPVFAIALLLVLGASLLVAAATVRRLHDVGRSGWWYALPGCCAVAYLLAAIPGSGIEGHGLLAFPFRIAAAAGSVALMVFLRQPGDGGANSYGPPPDDQTDHEEFRSQVERVDARIAEALARRSQAKPEPEPPPRPPEARTFGRRGL
jgi:uncharacterized membrane protein YhaH (DUF805 family)